MNTLLEIIGKFGNYKRDIKPVPLIKFENDLATSSNTATYTKTNPKSDEKQQRHDNNQQIFSKNSVRTVKKKVTLTQF